MLVTTVAMGPFLVLFTNGRTTEFVRASDSPFPLARSVLADRLLLASVMPPINSWARNTRHKRDLVSAPMIIGCNRVATAHRRSGTLVE